MPRLHKRHRLAHTVRCRSLESLEARVLLAGDLVAQWRADDILPEQLQGDVVSSWVDGQSGAVATAEGTPLLVPGALGGRAAVRFDGADGSDLLRVEASSSPMKGANDYSIAVVFQSSDTNIRNAGGDWFHYNGLVDGSQLGFSDDWGISLAPDGTVATGMGESFLDPPTTIRSQQGNLNDGLPHVVIVTRGGSELSIYVDGAEPTVGTGASSDPRSTSVDLVIGDLQTRGGPFTGDIAEVRVFDGKLTGEESSSLYDQLVAYYNNRPATANDDSYSLDEDPAFFFSVGASEGVLANDTDPEGDPLTAELISSPSHGNLTLQSGGGFIYDPDPNFFGTDSFTYTANDFRPSAPATVTLNVRPVYDPAVPLADRYKTLPTDVLNVDASSGLLANDENPDEAPITARISSPINAGELTLLADGAFVYDPQGFTGAATFGYEVYDGTQWSAEASVTIIVNTPPEARDDTYQTDEDTILVADPVTGVLANDEDAEGDTLAVTLVDDVTHGTLALQSDGTFTYRPEENFFGTDQFTYRVEDGEDTSATAVVTLNVVAVDDSPVAVEDVYFGAADGSIVVTADAGVLANDTDVDSTSHTVEIVRAPVEGTIILEADGAFQYVPSAGFVGTDSFTYRVSDGTTTSEAEVTLFVGRSPVRISEFMAANSTGLETKTRPDPESNFSRTVDTPDWIEIQNLTSAPLDISGFHLTDDRSDLSRWTFPEQTLIPASGYLVVFATRADILDPALDIEGKLHTNFRLAVEGEYLAIVSADGSILWEYADRYPQQYPNVSYGLDAEGNPAYLTAATPGGANAARYIDVVADTRFSVDRAILDNPVDVEITTSMPEAVIRYTFDGSDPTPGNGFVYDGPITIDRTTTLRAAAFRDGYLSADIDTQTYIFVDQVIGQSGSPVTGPTGNDVTFPASWRRQRADYEMDPEIVQSDQYAGRMRDALLALPALSLTLPPEDIFGDRGLYANPEGTAEKATAAELIFPDGRAGFQIDAGARMQGGASRNPVHVKHSMSLRFREDYGTSRLNFPLFEGSPVTQFDSIHLRARYNNSWIHWDQGQRNRGSMIREAWMRDAMLAAGEIAAGQGRYVHLYLNGLYWGIYEMHERQDASHYAAYFGGQAYQYDATNAGVIVDGSRDSWAELRTTVRSGDWQAIQQALDVTNHIRYNIVQLYGGNQDLKGDGNWRTAGGGIAGAPWQFYSWDSERVLENVSTRQTSPVSDLLGFRGQLDNLLEYRVKFADEVHAMLFNEGPLTPENADALWMNRAEQLDVAIVAESARWGDLKQRNPLTRDGEWIREQTRLREEYFPRRTANVIGTLRRMRLYPDTEAAEFRVGGARQHGGYLGPAGQLLIENPNADGVGVVWYTLDGGDPRQEGGAIAPGAIQYDGNPLTLSRSTRVRARVLNGDEWSAVTDALFLTELPADASNLRITEINYNPLDGRPEFGESDVDGARFEFIELQNVAATAINLSGVKFEQTAVNGQDEGISFFFGPQTLGPGQRTVIVRDRAAFQSRYGTEVPLGQGDSGLGDAVPSQWTGGSLSNGGETLTVRDASGVLIEQLRYDDEGSWPDRADGDGATLERTATDGDPLDGGAWRSSREIGGSPGAAGSEPVETVVVNEILSNSDTPAVDRIEFLNRTGATIDMSGWYISDSSQNLTKYRLPEGTTIGPGAYLVLEETEFGFGFKGQESDDVWLVDTDPIGKPMHFIDGARFGATDTNVSLGRWPNGTGDLFPQLATSFGSPNVGPRLSPIVVSEIQYHPTVAVGEEPGPGEDLEFVEIWNTSAAPLSLEGWELAKAVRYRFAAETVLAPNGGVVVVSFDPVVNSEKATAFRAAYGVDQGTVLLGPYEGVLDNGGEKVELRRPESGGAGEPVMVDLVRYDDVAPWPESADGQGASLQRNGPTLFGNLATSWRAASPTPGVDNLVSADVDFNKDGVQDLADLELLAAGIRAGDLQFDLSGDGRADFVDYRQMVQVHLGLVFGDVTLDGIFNSSDLIAVFNTGEYEDGVDSNSTWIDGDWNGDGEFSSADLLRVFQEGTYVAEAQRAATAGPLLPLWGWEAQHDDERLNKERLSRAVRPANDPLDDPQLRDALFSRWSADD